MIAGFLCCVFRDCCKKYENNFAFLHGMQVLTSPSQQNHCCGNKIPLEASANAQGMVSENLGEIRSSPGIQEYSVGTPSIENKINKFHCQFFQFIEITKNTNSCLLEEIDSILYIARIDQTGLQDCSALGCSIYFLNIEFQSCETSQIHIFQNDY